MALSTVYLAHNIQPLGTYEEVTQAYASGTYTEHVLTSVELENFWLVGRLRLAGLALAALALVLYRSRRSETAGDVVAVGWLRPVFRYRRGRALRPAGGQLLYSLLWYGFQTGSYYDTLPMVVCLWWLGPSGYSAPPCCWPSP